MCVTECVSRACGGRVQVQLHASWSSYFMSNQVFGIALLLLTTAGTQMASIANEVLFKKDFAQSIHLQNVQLYSLCICFNVVCLLIWAIASGGVPVFDGFSTTTALLVLVMSTSGLSISVVLKYLGGCLDESVCSVLCKEDRLIQSCVVVALPGLQITLPSRSAQYWLSSSPEY